MSSNVDLGINYKEAYFGLPSKEDCKSTPHFCEENIWLLAKTIQERVPERLRNCYAVFISNDNNYIPLWRQTVSKQEDGFVVWDYHVVMVYFDEEKSFVFDFDTQLPFPSPFIDYCEETFKSDDILNPLYHRFFRVISAEHYLSYFSSDRRHMINEAGTWIKPPPDYPAIQSGEESHNLPHYISMKNNTDFGDKFGCVYNLTEFVQKFTLFTQR